MSRTSQNIKKTRNISSDNLKQNTLENNNKHNRTQHYLDFDLEYNFNKSSNQTSNPITPVNKLHYSNSVSAFYHQQNKKKLIKMVCFKDFNEQFSQIQKNQELVPEQKINLSQHEKQEILQEIQSQIKSETQVEKKLTLLESQVNTLQKQLFTSNQINSYLKISLNNKDEHLMVCRKEIIQLKQQIQQLELKLRDPVIIKTIANHHKQNLSLHDLFKCSQQPQQQKHQQKTPLKHINFNVKQNNSSKSDNNYSVNINTSNNINNIVGTNNQSLQHIQVENNEQQQQKEFQESDQKLPQSQNQEEEAIMDEALNSNTNSALQNNINIKFNLQQQRSFNSNTTSPLQNNINNKLNIQQKRHSTYNNLNVKYQKIGTRKILYNKQTTSTDLIKLDTLDSENQKLWTENENVQFLSQLVEDEEKFINFMKHSTSNSYSFLCEKIQRFLLDSRQFFNLILRLKRIIKASQFMTSSLSLHETLEKIVEETCQCLECDRVTVFITDLQRNELWSKIAKGQNKTIRIPIGTGIAGAVAHSKQKLNIYNAYCDERFNKDIDQRTGYKTHTILCYPILENQGQKCLGVIQCINKISGHFTKDDEELLQIISDFSRIVLKNALSFDEQYSIRNKLRQLVISGLQLNSSQSLNEVLHQGQQCIKDLLNIEDIRIAAYNAENDTLIFINNLGLLQEVNNSQGSLITECIDSNEQVFVKNCLNHPSYNPDIDINSSMPTICIPIINQSENYNIQNNQNKTPILGVIQMINLSGIGELLTNNSQNINQILKPRDQEMLNFVIQQLAQGIVSKTNQ